MEKAKFVEEEGYELASDEVDHGSSSEVYRCVRRLDGLPVRIKLLNVTFPLPRHLSSFQHEYNIVRSLMAAGVSGVVAIHDRISRPHCEALVLEDFGGEDLHKWLDREGSFAGQLDLFIDLAISLAFTLGQIHSQSVVHKDIKPSNIIWNRTTGVVKLTDFGIASTVIRSKDTNQSRVPFQALGSLPYLPPELSVRAESKSIDHRSDFYSLGVSFFQILTNRLPFQEKTPIRLLHAHMAKPAPRLHEIDPRIPLCISLVVSKLMAKSVELRYQSSRGLHFDLLHCKRWLEDKRQGRKPPADFVPGLHDVSDVFSFPPRLYGRERDIQLIRKVYDITSKEMKNQVLLVAGYSGVGKTSLINQLKVVKDQSYFIQGKYDYTKRDVPYSAIAAAFSDMIHQILSEDEESVASKRERLVEAMGSNGQMLINVVPTLQLLVGQQPAPHVDLGVSEMKTLFNQLFTRLIDVFCSFTPGKPLVLFLDDLHWADHPSLQLLQKLTCRASVAAGTILLVGGYRDNEITSVTHPLNIFVNELREKNVPLHHVYLQPLDLKDVNEMIANVLHYSDTDLTEPLSELVCTKTKGNPFFTISFLTKLYQADLIWFDYTKGCWLWNLEQIQSSSFTDNVVEFMAQDLRNLPTQTLNLLKIASFFGNRFDVRDVAQYAKITTDQAENDLWKALHEGFIIRSEGYDYQFLHDRVQQAAYECVEKNQRKQTHLGIGFYLMAKTQQNHVETEHQLSPASDVSSEIRTIDKRSQQYQRNVSREKDRFDVFDVVYHLNKAAELINTPDQRILLAKLNLEAAIKGKNTLAYDMARRVAAQGITLLPDDCWTTHHKLAFHLHLERAQCEYLCKDVDKAQELFEVLREQANDIWEIIEVYIHRNQFYICLERYEDLVHYGFECLATLGLQIDRNPTRAMIDEERAKIYKLLGDRKVADLINSPAATDARARGIQIIINKMCIGLFFVGNPEVLPLALCIAIKISIERGHDSSTAGLYAQYAWIECGMHRQALEEAFEWGKLGLDLCEQYALQCKLPDRGQVWELFYAFNAWLKRPLRSLFQGLEQGFKLCIESGDLVYGTGCAYHLLVTQWLSGLALPKILTAIDPYMTFARDANWSDLLAMMETIERQIKLLMDKPVQEEDEEFEQRLMRGISPDKLPLKYVAYCVTRMHYFYLMGNYSEALQLGDKAARALDAILSFKEAPEFYFMYSLTILAICKASNLFISRQDKIRIDKESKWKRVISKRDDKQRASWPSGKATGEGRDRKGDSYNLTKEKYEHYIRIVINNQAMLKKYAESAPVNYLHQYMLVEAELTRVQERIKNEVKEITSLLQILKKYDEVYEMALRNGFMQDAAVAKELAWQVLDEWAGQSLSQAVYCYSKWGASAKAKAITQATASYRRPSEGTAQHISAGPYSTTEIISSALDLDTVIEASQQLSSKLNYSDLLTSLMDLTMSNTCATKGVLLLTEEYCDEGVEQLSNKAADHDDTKSKQLYIKAKAECPLGEVVVKVLNVAFRGESIIVPNRVLNYCWRTKSRVLLRDATQDENFSNDVYIRKKRPFSILCTPITFKDKHYGILYFENDANTGIFTDDRLRLLQILTSQFMISIENSMLVERLKKTNKELKLKNNQLKEVDRLKDSFLAVASHELRTPLNGIIGMTSLLEDTSMTSEQKEYVDNIKASSETLMELVNDVLDLSKLKAMKVKLEEKRFSLAECLETSLKLVEFKAATKGLNLAYLVDPALPQYVVGDDMRLRQILLNLLNNSVKFTDSGEIVIVVSPFSSSSAPPSSSSTSSPSGSFLAASEAMRSESGDNSHQPWGRDHVNIDDADNRSGSDVDESSSFFTASSGLEEDGSSTQDESTSTSKSSSGGRKRRKNKQDLAGESSEGGTHEGEDQLMLHFEVRDTGIGIKAEDFHVLFKPFSQVDTSLSRKYGGTGLGLSICKRLCKMFHGKIWAESRSQRGSIFHFTCRVGVPSESEQPGVEVYEGNRLPQMSALLYIANETNRSILYMHLTRCGTSVTLAQDREEFLSALAKPHHLGDRMAASNALESTTSEPVKPYDFAILDTDTLGRAVSFLISKAGMGLPIILLSGLIEKETEEVQQFIRLYNRIHVMRLPLRQVRLLDDINEILQAFDENRAVRASSRRVGSAEPLALQRGRLSSEGQAPTATATSSASESPPPAHGSIAQKPEAMTSSLVDSDEANVQLPVTPPQQDVRPITEVLPMKEDEGEVVITAADDQDASNAEAKPEAPTVLVVEDNAMNRKLLSQILYKAGYQYQTAENGEFALQAIRKRRFDAVLMDLQMPVLDGLETTRRIRSMEAGSTARTPIIGITASVSEQDRAVCLGVGMDSFLSKPIKREHLLRILREWTSGPPVQTAIGAADASATSE